MVSQESEWLVVNSVFIDGPKIVVGATNSQRWDWDKKTGLSGADARTIVWVTLTDSGPNLVVREEAELFCARKDPLRKLALDKIPDLFEIAWTIKENRLDNQQAQEAFFGYQLR